MSTPLLASLVLIGAGRLTAAGCVGSLGLGMLGARRFMLWMFGPKE